MELVKTYIEDLFILKSSVFNDSRGEFIKTFNEEFLKKNNLNIEIKECYYSISKKNVIRGMHFQKPPFDHIKLVYVTNGSILDVVLDIRKNSSTFGKYFSINLKANDGQILIVPKGLAHGFKSLENNTIVHYMQTSCYKREYDDGVRYDSFGFNWNCENPIVSERDKTFKKFSEYETPFIKE
jgi:dTDP-4-dehydrorhamnose 3,5-epimerase